MVLDVLRRSASVRRLPLCDHVTKVQQLLRLRKRITILFEMLKWAFAGPPRAAPELLGNKLVASQ